MPGSARREKTINSRARAGHPRSLAKALSAACKDNCAAMMDLKHAILRLERPYLFPSESGGIGMPSGNPELRYVLLGTAPDKSLSFCLGASKMRCGCAATTRGRNSAVDVDGFPVRCLGTWRFWRSAAGGLLLAFPAFVRSFARCAKPLDSVFCPRSHDGSAFFALPAITSVRLGEYPSTWRCRRWIFLGVEFVLIVPIVVCTSFHLGAIGGDAALLGYI